MNGSEMNGSETNGRDTKIVTQHRLIGDLRQVIENAEELLKNTGHYDHGLYHTARHKLAQALAVANEELERCEEAQLARMIDATEALCRLHGDRDGEAKVLRAFH